MRLYTGGPSYSRTFCMRICLFTFAKKCRLSSEKWSFNLQIQDSQSKMTERI
jgi:hypothetical protein